MRETGGDGREERSPRAAPFRTNRRHLDRHQDHALRGASLRGRRTSLPLAGGAPSLGRTWRSTAHRSGALSQAARRSRRTSGSDAVRRRWVTRGVRECASRGSKRASASGWARSDPSTRWLPTGASFERSQGRPGARSPLVGGRGLDVVNVTQVAGTAPATSQDVDAREARCSHPRAGPSPPSNVGGFARSVNGCTPFMATGSEHRRPRARTQAARGERVPAPSRPACEGSESSGSDLTTCRVAPSRTAPSDRRRPEGPRGLRARVTEASPVGVASGLSRGTA